MLINERICRECGKAFKPEFGRQIFCSVECRKANSNSKRCAQRNLESNLHDPTGRARLQEINTLKESARLQQSIQMEPEPLPYQPTAITVKTVVDSMGIYLTYKDRFKESREVCEIETIIEKEVNILYWWQKLLMWIGIVFSLLFIVKLCLLIKGI